MNSLRLIGLLLDYPSEDLWEHQIELLEAVTESSELNAAQRLSLALYITTFCQKDLLDAQSAYTAMFDRGRATSLLLFEHVHGESRDRGQAMVDLMAGNAASGSGFNLKMSPEGSK